MMDDHDLGALPDADVVHSSMFTGEEEVFAFKRCISRLTEMGGERWAAFQGTADGS
jgi:protein AFG1